MPSSPSEAMIDAAIHAPLCDSCRERGPWSREPSSCEKCVRLALSAALSVVPALNWREHAGIKSTIAEMAKQAVRGHTKYCVGCHEQENEWEWIEWSEMLEAFADAVAASPQSVALPSPWHPVPTLLNAITKACEIIETGDARVMANEGPIGEERPELSLLEWRRLYRLLDSARSVK